MPYLSLQTNLPLDQEQCQTLLGKTSRTVAEILGKPESYVMVAIQAATPMLFAGNNEPLAYLQLKSLGLPDSSTEEFSQALCQFISDELGIATDRIYIEFSSPERHLWGWNSKTF